MVKIEDLKKIILPEIITNNKPGALINLEIDKIVNLINETLPCSITFIEFNRFVLNDLNSIRGRGSHSNNNISELFICLSGSCKLELFDGFTKINFFLKKNEVLYIPNNVWIDFYNFDNATIYVITSKVLSNNDNVNSENKSIHNLNEYLDKNNIPIEVGKEVYLRDFLIIEHVIPIYWDGKNRLLLTKKIFKYYKDLRLIFFYSHKIILNFTIIGSNGDESLQLFNNELYLNNGIFYDTYIEFDQSKYETNGFDKLVYMLGEKCRLGLIEASKKQNNIVVMRGSNDIVDPFIYIQIQQQYTPHQYKLYISSKTIPQLNIFNFEIIDYCKKTSDENIIIPNIEEAKIIFNYQYNNSMQKNFRMAIATISFMGFSSNMVKYILEKTEIANISLAHEVEVEMFIRRNITNLISLTQDTFLINPKVQEFNENITNINDIKDYNNVNFENIDISIKNRAAQLVNYFNIEDINILERIIMNYHNRGIDQQLLSKYSKIKNENNEVYYYANNQYENFEDVYFTIPESCK